MVGIMDISLQPNFTMLNENLHNLFRIYIIRGRIRAPPESELSDMIPTFQPGAKTNRRALQSKFKSWSKRMVVENNNLLLVSSGKIIVPKEKCDELIMSLHSGKHVPINTIIFQIKQKYTWTKKNFGMDLDLVVKVISGHCNKEECWNDIKSVLTSRELSRSYISREYSTSVQSSFPRGSARGRPIIYGLHEYNRQPLPLLPSKQFTSERYSYASRINNSILERNGLPMGLTCNWARSGAMNTFTQYMQHYADASRKYGADSFQNHQMNRYPSSSVGFVDIPEKSSMSQIPKKNLFLKALGLSRKHEKLPLRHKPLSTLISKKVGKSSVESNDSSRRRSLLRSCKKIRNIVEFKKLLKGAERNPKLYPTVLLNQKTKFLGGLSLAPKRICSRKMLSTFREEFHKRQAMEKHFRFRGHKSTLPVLRDRNKLIKKSSYHQTHEKFSYLSTPQKPPMRNAMELVNEGRYLSNGNEKEKRARANTVSNKDNFLRLRYNEEKKAFENVIDIYRLNDEVKTVQNDNPSKITKYGTFAAGNQAYSHKLLTTSNNLPVQDQSRQSRKGQCKDSVLKCQLLNNKCFKNRQEKMNLEDYISKMILPNANVLSQKSNPSSNIIGTPQQQFPFIGPYLIPVSSSASSIGFLPPTSFPLIVRPLHSPPLSNTQFQPMNVAGQSAMNTPIVWGYLADGRVNVLKPNDNAIPESVQSKWLPKNNECLVGNKCKRSANVLIQPYRLLAPKNKVPGGLEMQPNASRKSDSDNTSLRNINLGIRGNKLQKKPGGNPPIFFGSTRDTDDSTSKDVDTEMKKLTNWIRRMKVDIVPSAFEKNIENSKMNLTAELNYGIGIVREVRSALEIQNNL